MQATDVHCKSLALVPDPLAYVDYHKRLEAGRLGPRILKVTDEEICVHKHQTLRQWVDQRLVAGRLPDEPRRAMGRRLIELLEQVHELGFCHRDTHIRNFVVRDGAPLLVDPKYAIESRGQRCYDLEGPEVSGVEIAREHLCQKDNVNQFGVWWENADPKGEALESTFGTVAELRHE